MSAGTGLTHSEYNHSAEEQVHFLQVWILPRARGLAPGYEQRAFAEADSRGRLLLVAAGDGRQGALTVHQDVDLWVARLGRGQDVAHPLRPGRHAWVQVARGAVTLNGQALEAGDGAALSDETEARITASEAAEVLLFDLK
jgi:redox-sensitive bicupin YhaK (pirin superfamily)